MGSIKTTVDKMQLVKEETEEHFFFFFFFYQTEREKRQMSKAQYEVKA